MNSQDEYMNEDPQLLDDEAEAGAGLSRARRWVIAVAVGAVVPR